MVSLNPHKTARKDSRRRTRSADGGSYTQNDSREVDQLGNAQREEGSMTFVGGSPLPNPPPLPLDHLPSISTSVTCTTDSVTRSRRQKRRWKREKNEEKTRKRTCHSEDDILVLGDVGHGHVLQLDLVDGLPGQSLLRLALALVPLRGGVLVNGQGPSEDFVLEEVGSCLHGVVLDCSEQRGVQQLTGQRAETSKRTYKFVREREGVRERERWELWRSSSFVEQERAGYRCRALPRHPMRANRTLMHSGLHNPSLKLTKKTIMLWIATQGAVHAAMF